jgi:hypothetical protein
MAFRVAACIRTQEEPRASRAVTAFSLTSTMCARPGIVKMRQAI